MKFKLILYTTLFITTISCNAQVIKKVLGKELNMSTDIDWYGWKTDISDDKLRQEVKKLKNINYLDHVADNFNLYKNSLNPVDFNSDGLTDIIFYGNPGGAETNFVICCMNTGTGYQEKLTAQGNIIELSEYTTKRGLEITIHNYACCLGEFDHIYKYIPDSNSKIFSFIKSDDIALYNQCTAPDNYLTTNIEFMVTTNGYSLRADPFIDNTSYRFMQKIKGNTLAIYPKNSTGYAIAEKYDNTGRKWWYVIMNNNINPIKSIFESGFDYSNNYKLSGWMSSRYLIVN